MAFGTGVLFSSVAFDLLEDALETGGGRPTTAGIASGPWRTSRATWPCRTGAAHDRKSAAGDDGSTATDEEGNPAAIVVGAVLDGIPESVAIGISLLEGGHIGGVFVAAVFMSNIPEALSASAGLAKQGRPARSIMRMWAVVVAASTLASLAGYALLDGTNVDTIAFLSAFAAGAVLTMLASTMAPEAAREGGPVSGLITTGGFLLAVMLDYAT